MFSKKVGLITPAILFSPSPSCLTSPVPEGCFISFSSLCYRAQCGGGGSLGYKLQTTAVSSNHKITPVPPPHLPAADEQRNLLENDPHPPQPSLCSTLPPSPSTSMCCHCRAEAGRHMSHVSLLVTALTYTPPGMGSSIRHDLSYSVIVSCRMFNLFSILLYPWPHLNMETI